MLRAEHQQRLSLSLAALKRQARDRFRASPTVRAQPPTRGNFWRSLTLTARYALPPLLTGEIQVLRVPAPAPASSSYPKLRFAQRGCEYGGGGGGCTGQARGLRGAGESFAGAERRRRNAPHGYGFAPRMHLYSHDAISGHLSPRSRRVGQALAYTCGSLRTVRLRAPRLAESSLGLTM